MQTCVCVLCITDKSVLQCNFKCVHRNSASQPTDNIACKNQLVCNWHRNASLLKICALIDVSESVQRIGYISQKNVYQLCFPNNVCVIQVARMWGALNKSFRTDLSATLQHHINETAVTHAFGLEQCPKGSCMMLCRCRRFTSQLLLAWMFSRF